MHQVHSTRTYSSAAQCILLMHQVHSTRTYSSAAQCILLMHQVHSTRTYSSTAQCILLMHQVHSTRTYSSTAQCMLLMHQVHSTRTYSSTAQCMLLMYLIHCHIILWIFKVSLHFPWNRDITTFLKCYSVRYKSVWDSEMSVVWRPVVLLPHHTAVHNSSTWIIFHAGRQKENCALLDYYAASNDNSLRTFRNKQPVPSSRVKNPWTLEDRTDKLSRKVGRELPLLAA